MIDNAAQKSRDKYSQQWSFYLDKDKENSIMIRYVYSPNINRVLKFSVMYYTLINGQLYEVIRYDCSQKEKIHVHYFYKKSLEKRFLNDPVDFNTMWKYVTYIQNNWQQLRTKLNLCLDL